MKIKAQAQGTQGGAINKRVVVVREEEQKRGYDGDWLYSRTRAGLSIPPPSPPLPG